MTLFPKISNPNYVTTFPGGLWLGMHVARPNLPSFTIRYQNHPNSIHRVTMYSTLNSYIVFCSLIDYP